MNFPRDCCSFSVLPEYFNFPDQIDTYIGCKRVLLVIQEIYIAKIHIQ